MEQRVVVTGIGVLASKEMDTESFWNNVKEGKSSVEKLKTINTEGLPSQIGAELKSFDPLNFIERRQAKRMDRYAQLSAASAAIAFYDSEIKSSSFKSECIGVFEGTSLGPLAGTLNCHRAYVLNECSGIHPYLLISSMIGAGSGFISMSLGLHGPSTTISEGSVSSACAVGYAFRQIKSGILDAALAGGAEAPISREIIEAFCSARLLSLNNEKPSCAVKPFDMNRDGFVLSEGAAFLFLESLEHALNRGAKIYAEVTGFGETSDAFHPTSQNSEGIYIVQAMRSALMEARLQPSDIQYLNAHGTATKMNDVVEAKAIKTIFPEEENNLLVSSTKSITGHLLGACGAIESIITVLAIKNQFVPGNISLQNPDPGCDIKSLPVEGVPKEIKNAVNNNYSFGGRNTSLIFSSFKVL